MAAAVTYTNFGGMLVHENRGGVETEYVNDTLGSLVECRDTSGTKTYEATYWPYGEIRTSTGTNPSPWAFVGLLGYLRETSSRTYVRARYYRQEIARWMTVDPLWPDESAYGYVRGLAVMDVDPSGLHPLAACMSCARGLIGEAEAAASRFCREYGFGAPTQDTVCNAMLHCMISCLIAKHCHLISFEWWECAKWITDAHETDGWCPPYRYNPGKQRREATCMDLYNNRIGINCGQSVDCYSCCRINIRAGKCMIIAPSPNYPRPGWKKCKTTCKTSPDSVVLPPIRK